MEKEKLNAMYCHAMMYGICFTINGGVTPRVDKWMKQIRLGMRKELKGKLEELLSDVQSKWDETMKKFVGRDEIKYARTSEILMTIYNKIPKRYQNLYYTDKTFTKVINGFASCHRNTYEDVTLETNFAREVSDEFLRLLGIDTENSLLKRLATKNKNNLILEGKI